MATRSEPLEQTIRQEASEERVWQHVRTIVEDYPERIGGTGSDVRAAGYLRSQMAACDVDVEWVEMDLLNSREGTADLRVLSPETRVIDADCCLHIASTTSEGITADLVYVGAGGLADYEGKDVRGKIVLAEVSYAPATPEKARIAAVRGAVGIIAMNWGTAEMPYVPKRALKAVWGNPTPATIHDIPQVAGAAITRAAGEYLRDLCRRGPVRLRLRAQSPRVWETLVQPVGRIRGERPEADQFIILSGHFDCWPPGATDNATGNGAMLELARVFARHRGNLRRSLVFAFWNGHEVAEAAGSAWYVDHEWDDIQRHAVAYLNIDSLGMLGATRYTVKSSPELMRFHAKVEQDVLGAPGERTPLSRTGDQSFFGIGVPAVVSRFSYTPEQVKAWNGATLGWWNHTDQDTLDKVDRALVARELTLWATHTVRLATEPVLPMRFEPLAREVRATVGEMLSAGPDAVGLESLARRVDTFAERAARLDRVADTLAQALAGGSGPPKARDAALEVNACLLQLSRLLTAPLRTVAGRYGQDSYGLSDLDSPIPALLPLKTLRALPPQSEAARLLRTELRRRRNAIADGLSDAAWLIERIIRHVEV